MLFSFNGLNVVTLKRYLLWIAVVLMAGLSVAAQPITGVWRGKTGKGVSTRDVEVKLVLKGDSIAGTAYYYQSKNRYVRYSVKGYFNPYENSVVWWDDVLLESKSYNQYPLLSEADFNCPGEGVMKLDGNARQKDEEENEVPTHLRKMATPVFADEWDPIIANYGFGSNNPELIDSVAAIAFQGKPLPPEEEKKSIVIAAKPKKTTKRPVIKETVLPPVVKTTPKKPEITIMEKPLSTEEKFATRKKEFTTSIPMNADSIVINFYDNAEIDGDTISIYLDNRLIHQNIGLSGRAFVVTLTASQLQPTSELVMVAENLGSIPPNTSLMVAYVGELRYEARLQSTEKSSALIRLVK